MLLDRLRHFQLLHIHQRRQLADRLWHIHGHSDLQVNTELNAKILYTSLYLVVVQKVNYEYIACAHAHCRCVQDVSVKNIDAKGRKQAVGSEEGASTFSDG